ncbi:hypothetical protein ACIQM4_07375 [Streptomyces sp. NPDC091272]|uniref:hypothetical protein n=1 Tax=Streptomyces sp. NPDC091272 TaxID=3365981 RepID=UPI003813E8D2
MSAGAGQDGSPSLSDEDWERFLRESEAGAPDAPKEPSARARMVTRRLREEPARDTAWRAHTPARRGRRGSGWFVAGLLVALALVVVALVPGLLPGWLGGAGAASGPFAADPVRPDAASSAQAAQRPTLDEPFRGSPATLWDDGTAGIPVPEARATGWMGKAQVAAALARTRDFLAASSLDSAVLRGARPTEAIALINPQQQDTQEYLTRSLRTPTEEQDPLLLFSRFDPAHTRLVGDVIKTRGGMTFREGEHGALQVSTDVTYVYPVVRAAAGSTEVARTIVRREIVVNWDDPSKVRTEKGTLSLVSYKVDMTNGGCRTGNDPHTGYFTPDLTADRQTEGPTDSSRVDPYDRDRPMSDLMGDESTDKGCRTATRT